MSEAGSASDDAETDWLGIGGEVGVGSGVDVVIVCLPNH